MTSEYLDGSKILQINWLYIPLGWVVKDIIEKVHSIIQITIHDRPSNN